MKDLIRMNQLAGLITESQARKMMAVLNEDNLEVKKEHQSQVQLIKTLQLKKKQLQKVD
jgi:type III secretory pathway lipoprotein EscJ